MPVCQILVQNTTDYDKLSAERQNAVKFEYESQKLIPMNETPILSGHISANSNGNNASINQSLADLRVITNGKKK